jgi:uncharacterized protein YoxC
MKFQADVCANGCGRTTPMPTQAEMREELQLLMREELIRGVDSLASTRAVEEAVEEVEATLAAQLARVTDQHQQLTERVETLALDAQGGGGAEGSTTAEAVERVDERVETLEGVVGAVRETLGAEQRQLAAAYDTLATRVAKALGQVGEGGTSMIVGAEALQALREELREVLIRGVSGLASKEALEEALEETEAALNAKHAQLSERQEALAARVEQTLGAGGVAVGLSAALVPAGDEALLRRLHDELRVELRAEMQAEVVLAVRGLEGTVQEVESVFNDQHNQLAKSHAETAARVAALGLAQRLGGDSGEKETLQQSVLAQLHSLSARVGRRLAPGFVECRFG